MALEILMVDDEEDLEVLIKQKFRHCIADNKMIVHFAKNGHEALAFLQAHPVRIVVTDLSMPGMDGYTLLAHLQERTPKITTLVMSAYSDPSHYARVMDYGVFRFLVKPIDLNYLKDCLWEAGEEIATSDS